MNKKTKSVILKIVMLLPVIACLVSTVLCAVVFKTDGKPITYIVFGTIGVYGVLAVVLTVLILTNKRSGTTKHNAANEYRQSGRSSGGKSGPSRYEQPERSKKRKRRNSSNMFGTIFLASMLALFVGIIVFASHKIYIGMWICFGLFAGTIIALAIYGGITTQRAEKKRKASLERAVATCVKCDDVGLNGDDKRYKVTFNLNGQRMTAHSKFSYDVGESVEIAFASPHSNACEIYGEDK